MNVRVRLREKSALVEAEVKKLEDEIEKDFLDKETRVIKQGAHNHVDKFGDYRPKLISLMPCIGPHIPKRIDHGGALQMIRCMT